MANNESGNGFDQYRYYLIKELERIDKSISRLDTKQDAQHLILSGKIEEARIDIRGLQARSRIWGAITGAVAGTAFSAIVAWIVGG